ncbi:putative hydrolase PNKD [Toxocara canis]|uniref:Putative hydrolase PNKD n=1 Tax=Toxocara canis TaxID=6265 RepID=A0A0B2W3H3_TOXCA|nr:putative hydrolase PNKD [Toxocara canis]
MVFPFAFHPVDNKNFMFRLVKNGEVIEVGKLRFTVILVPGHTKGHAIYRLHTENGPDCLFTGDFLFIAGIGKMFEGSAKRMLRSLSFLDNLPRSALVFPGHEYSMENIEFALRLEPSNGALLAVDRLVRDRRMHKLPSDATQKLAKIHFLRFSSRNANNGYMCELHA